MDIAYGIVVLHISCPQLFQPLKAVTLQRLRYSFTSPCNLAFSFGWERKSSFSNAENYRIAWGFCEELYVLLLVDGE